MIHESGHSRLLRSPVCLISTCLTFPLCLYDFHFLALALDFMSVVETADVLVGLLDAAALGEVSVPDYAHLVWRGEVVWEFEVAGKGFAQRLTKC